MTRTKIFVAAVAVWSIILVAAGATFRAAPPNGVKPLIEENSAIEENSVGPVMKKGDRLPFSTPQPSATTVRPVLAPPVVPEPEQLPLATEDDLRQAEAEHHRHRDICPHGRTYFAIQHHQYWRCKL